MSDLLTIGYEGRHVGEFVQDLLRNGVRVLVDVRWTPISRKKGFSKTVLRQAMEEAGIEYVHLKALGSPKTLRNRLFESGNYEEFFDNYRKHLVDNNSALHEIVHLSERGPACLLCFEREPHVCHRHVVADELLALHEGNLRVRHI